MIYYKDFKPYKILEVGKRKKYDNNIFTFDIETTSFIVHNGVIYNNEYYERLSKKEQELCKKCSTMYIWQLSINEDVYFGRTWNELKDFIKIIDNYSPNRKIIYVHNLAFEFQYLMRVFEFEHVMARKSHKVMKAELKNFNFEFRCSLYMSNERLESLSNTYNLPVKKLVGNLDYTKLRHSETILSDKELSYCENDCLILYHYIKLQRELYEEIHKIPVTSTGFVRRELFNLTLKNYKYKRKVNRAINTDPHIYNLLVYAFQGGYTHSNFLFTSDILKNVDSYDITSSYPSCMTTKKFPSKEFKPCKIIRIEDMLKSFAYLLVVKFRNVKSKYYNHFISGSKCFDLKGAKYDNGRIISADSFKMVLTDIDLKLYNRCYSFEYEIEESYYSKYDYLPIDLINFILDKYVKKTEYKGVKEKELEYNLEKARFNSIYGMCVTRTISDEVIFNDGEWNEIPLTNDEIIKKLDQEKKKSFLSFSYGVWCTAWARASLIERILDKDTDKYTIYCDTDSAKLIQGYDKNVFLNYNKSIEENIEKVSKVLNIDINKFKPKDKKGKERMIGTFEFECRYQEFCTQGAKKYAYKLNDEINITVAGVPKKGKNSLKDLSEFKDGLLFKYKDTNKMLLYYIDNQEPIMMKDYQGNEYLITDVSGCCLLPCSYTLGKSLDYAELIQDTIAERSLYKE